MDYTQSAIPGLPRGIRNNNPGNIKDDGQNWQGVSGTDGTFYIFADTTWGLRAIAKAITNMIAKGLNTITLLISAWSATDQAAYINNVSQATGQGANDLLQSDPATLHDIIRGIVDQENGAAGRYVTDQDIDQGIAMAASGVATLPQAAVVAAEANPGKAILIGLGVLIAVNQLLK